MVTTASPLETPGIAVASLGTPLPMSGVGESTALGGTATTAPKSATEAYATGMATTAQCAGLATPILDAAPPKVLQQLLKAFKALLPDGAAENLLHTLAGNAASLSHNVGVGHRILAAFAAPMPSPSVIAPQLHDVEAGIHPTTIPTGEKASSSTGTVAQSMQNTPLVAQNLPQVQTNSIPGQNLPVVEVNIGTNPQLSAAVVNNFLTGENIPSVVQNGTDATGAIAPTVQALPESGNVFAPTQTLPVTMENDGATMQTLPSTTATATIPAQEFISAGNVALNMQNASVTAQSLPEGMTLPTGTTSVPTSGEAIPATAAAVVEKSVPRNTPSPDFKAPIGSQDATPPKKSPLEVKTTTAQPLVAQASPIPTAVEPLGSVGMASATVTLPHTAIPQQILHAARAAGIDAAMEAICAKVEFFAGARAGEGEVRINFNRAVLSGSSVRLMQNAGGLQVEFTPATAEVAAILTGAQPMILQRLAAAVPLAASVNILPWQVRDERQELRRS